MRKRRARLAPLGTRRPRRSRWPFLLLGALAALLVGEIADQVVGSSTSAARRSVASWVAAVGPLVDESTSLGPTVQAVRQKATTGTRASLERELELVTSGSADLRQELADLPLAPPSAAVGAALSRCFADRASASLAVSRAVNLATGTGGSEGALAEATSTLESAATQLDAADAAYAEARSLLGRRGRSLPRHSVWAAPPSLWSPSSLQSWAGVLRGDPALAGRTDLVLAAVTVSPRVLEIHGLPTTTTSTTTTTTSTTTTTTTPATSTPGATTTSLGASKTTGTTRPTLPPVATSTTLQLPPEGSVSVLQSTGRLSVAVVVADDGTMPVGGVALEALLEPSSGGGRTQSVGRRIGSIEADAARYVVLDGLRPAPGQRYELVVTASAAGGSAVTDRVALCDASAGGSCP